MQNDGEDDEQAIDVGLGIQRFIGLGAARFSGGKNSTADQLVRFDSFNRNAFAKKEHVLAIFFDLEKAYGTTWKYGILSELYDLDFRGHLPTFIDGFLSHRLFQVRAGSTLSDSMIRRWVFLREVSCLRFFSLLKLAILSSLS